METNQMQLTKELLADIFTKDQGYMNIRCGSNRKGIYVPAGTFAHKDPFDYIFSKHLKSQNKSFTLATFWSKGSADIKNLRSVNAIAIDLEFLGLSRDDPDFYMFFSKYARKNKIEHCAGEEAEMFVYVAQVSNGICNKQNQIPLPTYMVYGENLRLIYVFSEPVFFSKGRKKEKTDTITWLTRIQKELCKIINSKMKMFDASPVPLNAATLMPMGKDVKYTKDGNYYDEETGKIKARLTREWSEPVKVMHGEGGKYNAHDLSDMVLPPLPDWYDDYKAGKTKPRVSLKKTGPKLTLWHQMSKRKTMLESYQRNGFEDNENKDEEKMCFIYYNTCLSIGMNPVQAQLNTINFNWNFKKPCKVSRIAEFSMDRLYKYKNSTLLSELGISDEFAAKYGVFPHAKKDYDREYSKERYKLQKKERTRQGETKAQHMAKDIKKAVKLKAEGLSLRKIGEKLGRSASTVMRYLSTAEPQLQPI